MSARKPSCSSVLTLGLAVVAVALGCAGKKKNVRSTELLSGELAYRRGMAELSAHRLTDAIETLGRIQYTPEAVEEFEPLSRLAVADATFFKDTELAWIDARNLYLDFVTLYGDHPLASYAQTQAGVCSLRQVNDPSRDQSQTHQAITDLSEVARRYPGSSFATVAGGYLRTARSNLAESEFMVGRFYMKRKQYIAAAERFNIVLADYPDFTATDKVLYHLARTLLALKSDVKGRLYLDQLLADYPTSEWAGPARELRDRPAGGPAKDAAPVEE